MNTEDKIIVGNKFSKTYHLEDCMYAPKLLEKRIIFNSISITY